jgi:excisionase family DNA binding protein
MKLWLNVAEGAEYAGVCRDLIYDACAARRLHHIRVGGRRAIRLKREWIDAWLERHAVVAQDGAVPERAETGTGTRTEGRP